MLAARLNIRAITAFTSAGLIVIFGHEVAKALASPLLGVIAANLLFVSAASLWASLSRGKQGRSG